MVETDLELLESYLDGELGVSESEGLWRRLAAEPQLAAALDELRAQRTARSALWQSLEPTDNDVDAFGDRLDVRVRRRRALDWTHRSLRYVTAAAACIVVGFSVGWSVRGGPGSPAGSQVGAPAQAITPVAVASPVSVPISDSNGNVIATPTFDSVQQLNQFVNDLRTTQSHAQPRDYSQNVLPVSAEEQQF